MIVVVLIILVLVAYYFGTMDGRREGYLKGRLDADKFKDANMMWRFEENYKKIYTKDNNTEDIKQD